MLALTYAPEFERKRVYLVIGSYGRIATLYYCDKVEKNQ